MPGKLSQLILLISILFSSTSCLATVLPMIKPVPGGITVVPLDAQNKPTAYYNEQQVLILANPDIEISPWIALVGIPLTASSGEHELQVASPVRFVQPFKIHNKGYKIRQLANSDGCQQYPSFEYLSFPPPETKNADAKILKHWSESDPLVNQFVAPVHGRIITNFGVQQEFDDQLYCQHTGLDIAAPAGTPVKATAAGIVLAITQQDGEGKTIYLDHGQGLISIYAHVANTTTTVGQHVPQAKKLGVIAAQQNTPQSYIHWGIVLNQTYVEPTLFVLKGHIIFPPDPSPAPQAIPANNSSVPEPEMQNS